jgi:hypothetical protein
MEPVIVKLDGLAKLVLRRLVLLTATIKDTVLADHVSVIPSTPDVIAQSNNAPMVVQVLGVV